MVAERLDPTSQVAEAAPASPVEPGPDACEQDWRLRAVSQLLDADVAMSHGLTEVAREHIGDVAQAIINDLLNGGGER